MTDTALTADEPNTEPDHGLYVTDAEIIRELGYGETTGRRILKILRRGVPGMRPYPQEDPLFPGKCFWPAVLQWHMDYHGVRSAKTAPSVQPKWEENFDAPASRKAREPERPRPQLART
jgi:hypothetical protein